MTRPVSKIQTVHPELCAVAPSPQLRERLRERLRGVGVFGGLSIPVLNDLSGQGSQFGVRVPVSLVPMLTVEPFFSSSALFIGAGD